MSLGITALWRDRPQQRLGFLIPREPLPFNGPPTYRFSPSLAFTTVTGSSHSNTAQGPGRSSDEAEADGIDRHHADELPKPSPITRPKVGGRTDEPLFRRMIYPRRARAPKDEVQKLEESLERSKFVNSVLVEPAKIYPHKQETRESWRDHYKSVSAQVYFQRVRQKSFDSRITTDTNISDWRKVFGLLWRHTPEQSKEWIEDGIKIELPESVFAMVMDEGGDNKVGAIRRRTGASIKASTGENPEERTSLLLSGTREAINRATEELRSIVGPVVITRLLSPLSPGQGWTEPSNRKGFFSPPLTREEGGPFRRFKVDYDISTIPWPDTMSHQTFEEYVASLTDSVILPHLNSVLYSPTKYAVLLDHERAVARQLQSVFTRQHTRRWASCSALKLALSFLCEKGDKYLPEARSIFVSMDQHGLRMDADVFNILLRAPTKIRNLRKFQQTLLLMTRRGFAPNLDTWILFLRMVESVEVRSYILRAMHMKNLLGTPEAIQRVAEEMARFDADHAVQLGKDLDIFIQEQDERYGPDWLTRDAGNQVLNVLCRYGRYHDAFKLLNIMHARAKSIPVQFAAAAIAARPDVVSYNTIILHAKRHGKLNVLVNTIRKMKTVAFATQPDMITLHLLFEMAWHTHMRATVSVIWRYAALARLTTWRMRLRVAALLDWKPGEADSFSNYGISSSTYRQLGGENLASDLAGGKAALDRIRSIAAGHDRAELAVLAAKVWPKAFDDFGPTISLASALSLAVSRDWAFHQAQKQGKEALRRLWVKIKPKILPLKERGPIEVGWVDLAPLDDVDPDRIGPEDGRDEFRDLNVLRSKGPPAREGLGVYDRFGEEMKPVDDEEVAANSQSSGERKLVRKVMYRREMAIMGPDLWARDETPGRLRPHRWSALQEISEEDILAALKELEKDYPSPRQNSQLFEGEMGETEDGREDVVEEYDETDQGIPKPIESGKDYPIPVQDDVAEGLPGPEPEKMTDHEQEAEDPSEDVSGPEIVKRGDNNG